MREWLYVAVNTHGTGTITNFSLVCVLDFRLVQASMGCNGIIDMDGSSGDMTHSLSCSGDAWWQVDLGELFNLTV